MLKPFEKEAFLARPGLRELGKGVLAANLSRLGRSVGAGAATHARRGALLGGGVGAAYGAATAEEGQRLEGAARGALGGAAIGGLGGSITGATRAGSAAAAKHMGNLGASLGHKLDAARGYAGAAEKGTFGRAGRRILGQVGAQTVGGAGFGGLLGAGAGAAGAEEGQRLEGALRGFGGGALMGAAGGAVSGGIQGTGQVARLNAMRRAGATAGQANQALTAGWRQNLKNIVNADTPGARRANLLEAVAAPATLAADIGLGGMLMSSGQPPEQVRTASAYDEESLRVEPLYVTPLVGAAVRSTVDPALEKVIENNPEHFLARHPKTRKYLLPTAATMALTIPTVKTIRNLSPSPADIELKQLDLEALKQDYGKSK